MLKSYTKNIFQLVLILSLALPLRVHGQVKHALLVGISKYENRDVQSEDDEWKDIHGTNDVQMITPILKRQGFKTKTLCNREATAQRIRKELKALAQRVKVGDMVYFHFSCHGQPVEDLDGDEEDGWDEAIVPYDAQMKYVKGKYEGNSHILDDELHSYLQQMRKAVGKAGFVCVVIDACHAGGSSRGDEEDTEEAFCRGTKRGFSATDKPYRPRINALGHFTIPNSPDLSHIAILEACRSYQSNYEIKQDGKYYGPLSFYVTKTLEISAISPSLTWILEIKRMMDADRRLVRQNMVYETSLK